MRNGTGRTMHAMLMRIEPRYYFHSATLVLMYITLYMCICMYTHINVYYLYVRIYSKTCLFLLTSRLL